MRKKINAVNNAIKKINRSTALIITEIIFKPERKSYAIAMYASCQNMQSIDNSANGMLKHK